MTDKRREYYISRFNLPYKGQNKRRSLPAALLDQLDQCKDDETRRILLGISVLIGTDSSAVCAVAGLLGGRAIWPMLSVAEGADQTPLKTLSPNASNAI